MVTFNWYFKLFVFGLQYFIKISTIVVCNANILIILTVLLEMLYKSGDCCGGYKRWLLWLFCHFSCIFLVWLKSCVIYLFLIFLLSTKNYINNVCISGLCVMALGNTYQDILILINLPASDIVTAWPRVFPENPLLDFNCELS